MTTNSVINVFVENGRLPSNIPASLVPYVTRKDWDSLCEGVEEAFVPGRRHNRWICFLFAPFWFTFITLCTWFVVYSVIMWDDVDDLSSTYEKYWKPGLVVCLVAVTLHVMIFLFRCCVVESILTRNLESLKTKYRDSIGILLSFHSEELIEHQRSIAYPSPLYYGYNNNVCLLHCLCNFVIDWIKLPWSDLDYRMYVNVIPPQQQQQQQHTYYEKMKDDHLENNNDNNKNLKSRLEKLNATRDHLTEEEYQIHRQRILEECL